LFDIEKGRIGEEERVPNPKGGSIKKRMSNMDMGL
jgi:hypothetical protein